MIIATSIGNYYKVDSFEKRAETFKKLGFDFVEMTSYETERVGLNKVLEILRKFDLDVTDFHLCFNDCLDMELEKFKQKLIESIDIVKKLNTNIITFHSGQFKNSLEESKRNLFLVLSEVIDTFKSEGLILAIENQIRAENWKCVTVYESEMDWILSKFPISLLYDINHGVVSGENIHNHLVKYKDRLWGLHLGDAISGKGVIGHEHLPMGKGEIDFKKVCDLIKKDKDLVLIIELQNNGSYEDLAIFKQNLEKYLGE